MAYKDDSNKNEEGMQEKLIQVNRVSKWLRADASSALLL